jgi:hypothetical protein
MSAESIQSPVPLCEACYVKKNAEWEPESIDERGNILMRLKGVPTPPRYNMDTVENCSNCGLITIVGIYELTEPEVLFPDEDTF